MQKQKDESLAYVRQALSWISLRKGLKVGSFRRSFKKLVSDSMLCWAMKDEIRAYSRMVYSSVKRVLEMP